MVSYSDPFGLCPESVGGDGKTAAYYDCPEGSRGLAEWRHSASGKVESGWADPLLFIGGLEVREGEAAAASLGSVIARGHAFAKHVLARGEFQGLEIRTVKQLAKFVDDLVERAAGQDVKVLSRGRTAFWDSETGTVVIRDPRSKDLGTVFRPTNGRSYFDGLK